MENINAAADYSRYERFAQLRAAYPNMDAADIFECIHFAPPRSDRTGHGREIPRKDRTMNQPSKRKPHRDFAGYVAELRNPYSGGHTIIQDCKLAQEQGIPIVEDYALEGGRWCVVCNQHGTLVYNTNLPMARECMKDPTIFCQICRVISGNGPEDWESAFAPFEVEMVRAAIGEA